MKKIIRIFFISILAFACTATSQAGLRDILLPKASTVFGVAAIGAAIYASNQCKVIKDQETGQARLACKKATITQSESLNEGEKPSLIDDKGKKHILEGDGPKAGGGHRNGTDKPGKSEFPADWSDEKIVGEISDIATDPNTEWTEPDVRGYVEATGIRDGVAIKVVFNTKLDRIVTGYPLNLGRNNK